MKFREIHSDGSFKAWGIGLNYEYDAQKCVLDVIHAGKKLPLLHVDFDQPLVRKSLDYVGILEKTTQINALVLSNNTTIDLSEIIDEEKLVAILANSATVARYAFDLRKNNFSRFSRFFAEDNGLQSLKIERFRTLTHKPPSYKVELTTSRSNTISVSASTLTGSIHSLAEKIIQDVVTREITFSSQNAAHGLLRTSSKLSKLGFILNDHFVPARKLAAQKEKLHQHSA